MLADLCTVVSCMLAELCTVDGLREDVNGLRDSWKRCYMETILLKNATSSSNWSSYLEKRPLQMVTTYLLSQPPIAKGARKKTYGSCSVCMYIFLKYHKKACNWRDASDFPLISFGFIERALQFSAVILFFPASFDPVTTLLALIAAQA